MPTFTLALRNQQLDIHNALVLEEILRQETITVTTARGGTPAGDEKRLRGIPVIGRGITGAQPGTRPGLAL